MTDEPIVAVRGEVVREVAPELAELGVTVAARDKDRQTTLTRLTERITALRSLLDRYADAIERRETGAVFVRPETKRSGERVAAYTGTVSTTVTVTDFTVLGELLVAVADQDLTSVYGPSWSLRPDSPVYAEARRAAIADAFARGREYAGAVGARVVVAPKGAATDPDKVLRLIAEAGVTHLQGTPSTLSALCDAGLDRSASRCGPASRRASRSASRTWVSRWRAGRRSVRCRGRCAGRLPANRSASCAGRADRPHRTVRAP